VVQQYRYRGLELDLGFFSGYLNDRRYVFGDRFYLPYRGMFTVPPRVQFKRPGASQLMNPYNAQRSPILQTSATTGSASCSSGHCCCCVRDAKIENIVKYSAGLGNQPDRYKGTTLFGHYFDVTVWLDWVPTEEGGGDCTHEWYEYNDKPDPEVGLPNTWHDLETIPKYHASWGTSQWYSRPQNYCPWSEMITIRDLPGIYYSTGSRVLSFGIEFDSASSNDCIALCGYNRRGKTLFATQTLKTNATGDGPGTWDFDPFPTDPTGTFPGRKY
jgi:hypothetical protein